MNREVEIPIPRFLHLFLTFSILFAIGIMLKGWFFALTICVFPLLLLLGRKLRKNALMLVVRIWKRRSFGAHWIGPHLCHFWCVDSMCFFLLFDASSGEPYRPLSFFFIVIAFSSFPKMHNVILVLIYLTSAYFVILGILINLEVTQYYLRDYHVDRDLFFSSTIIDAPVRLFWINRTL